MSANAIRLAWGRYKRSHGVDGVRFHDFRHEAVSRLFEIGLTVPEVASISGHKTVSQLLRYAHHSHTEVMRKIASQKPLIILQQK